MPHAIALVADHIFGFWVSAPCYRAGGTAARAVLSAALGRRALVPVALEAELVLFICRLLPVHYRGVKLVFVESPLAGRASTGGCLEGVLGSGGKVFMALSADLHLFARSLIKVRDGRVPEVLTEEAFADCASPCVRFWRWVGRERIFIARSVPAHVQGLFDDVVDSFKVWEVPGCVSIYRFEAFHRADQHRKG